MTFVFNEQNAGIMTVNLDDLVLVRVELARKILLLPGFFPPPQGLYVLAHCHDVQLVEEIVVGAGSGSQ